MFRVRGDSDDSDVSGRRARRLRIAGGELTLGRSESRVYVEDRLLFQHPVDASSSSTFVVGPRTSAFVMRRRTQNLREDWDPPGGELGASVD